jgi:hypothetical protein
METGYFIQFGNGVFNAFHCSRVIGYPVPTNTSSTVREA